MFLTKTKWLKIPKQISRLLKDGMIPEVTDIHLSDSKNKIVGKIYSKRIFNPISCFMVKRASALPRASSTGRCEYAVPRQCLKFWKQSRTSPLYKQPRFSELWPNGFSPRKCQKYHWMNLASKPLLSLINIGRLGLFSWSHVRNDVMTFVGESNCRVSSREWPEMARTSGTNCSEIGRNCP